MQNFEEHGWAGWTKCVGILAALFIGKYFLSFTSTKLLLTLTGFIGLLKVLLPPFYVTDRIFCRFHLTRPRLFPNLDPKMLRYRPSTNGIYMESTPA
jgi:hypothetical protein